MAPVQDLLFLTTAPVGIELLQSHPGHRANRRLPSPSHENSCGDRDSTSGREAASRGRSKLPEPEVPLWLIVAGPSRCC